MDYMYVCILYILRQIIIESNIMFDMAHNIVYFCSTINITYNITVY